jgi:HEAT repeat protein
MKSALGIIVAVALGALGASTTASTVAARRTEPIAQQVVERGGPDSARVVRLLNALAAADPLVCELVVDPIGNFWWSGGPYGTGQLADSREAVREAKDSLNHRVSDPAAIRVLTARLSTDDPCVRQIASKMLGNSAITDDALGRLFDHESVRVREAALRAAGFRERPQLRARIERALSAREVPIVAMAAWALGELEQKASVPALRRVLDHEAAAVRLSATAALGNIEDHSAVADIEAMVTRDTDRRVRHVAIEALGEMEQARSVGVLAGVLDGRDLELSVAAAEAIGELDELETPPPALVRALESTHLPLRRAALKAIVDFHQDASLAPKILPHITDADPEVRRMVVEALGKMRARVAIPALKKALTDPDAEVRRAAIEALAEIDER